MARPDGRAISALRPVEMTIGFHRIAEGSVLYRAGATVVLCTASVDPKVPAWMEGKGKGWITAEYQMHPRSNRERRENRDGRGKAPSGRTQEIQRLVGRALRAAVDLEKLGERRSRSTATCSRPTAARAPRRSPAASSRSRSRSRSCKSAASSPSRVLREPVAATSVGHLDDAPRARSRLRRGLARRGRPQPRRDALGPDRRGAGHRRGRARPAQGGRSR